jgi:very-short-patch-repair endonuclease
MLSIMPLSNRPALKPLRRHLRAALTPAEARLWTQLQRSQLRGRKFRRQHSIGPYVVDFYCASEKLAVELDGAAHDHESATARDEARDAYLAAAGVKVIRFENKDVVANLEGVLLEIARQFKAT